MYMGMKVAEVVPDYVDGINWCGRSSLHPCTMNNHKECAFTSNTKVKREQIWNKLCILMNNTPTLCDKFNTQTEIIID